MRLYTMANDRMLPHFLRWHDLVSIFFPDLSVHVIPFNDDCDDLGTAIAQRNDVTLVTPSGRVDAIGKTIFEDEDYRPGIPSWRYFRKLNAFSDHSDPFIFMDANTIPLCDIRLFLDFDRLSDEDILFGQHSLPDRTVKDPIARSYLDLLIPGHGVGFNCGWFAATGGFLSLDCAQAMAKKPLRKIIGQAPEQGFLTLYAAYFLKNPRRIHEANADIGPLSNLAIYDDGHDFMRSVVGPFKDRICPVIKHTGQNLHEVPPSVQAFIDRTFIDRKRP